MKILITGNMGYVGPGVVKRLRDIYQKATLIGLDIGYFAHCLTGVNDLSERRLDQQLFSDARNISPSLLQAILLGHQTYKNGVRVY